MFLQVCMINTIHQIFWIILTLPPFLSRSWSCSAHGPADPEAALLRQCLQHQQCHQPLQCGQQHREWLQEEEEEELGECVSAGCGRFMWNYVSGRARWNPPSCSFLPDAAGQPKDCALLGSWVNSPLKASLSWKGCISLCLLCTGLNFSLTVKKPALKLEMAVRDQFWLKVCPAP